MQFAAVHESAQSGHVARRYRCRYWGESGHDVLRSTCPHLTQSGHWLTSTSDLPMCYVERRLNLRGLAGDSDVLRAPGPGADTIAARRRGGRGSSIRRCTANSPGKFVGFTRSARVRVIASPLSVSPDPFDRDDVGRAKPTIPALPSFMGIEVKTVFLRKN
jgi:hypothetical protein